jgi:ribokinase
VASSCAPATRSPPRSSASSATTARAEAISSADEQRVDVCVVGSFNADVVVRVPRRPGRGETVIGSSCDTYLGGKGFNQAVAAARAGATTSMVGALGDDGHGRQFARMLDLEHIDSSGVQFVAGTGTGIAFPVVEETGENSVIIVPQANHALTAADIDRLDSVIECSAVVLLQLELPVDVVVAAATVARRAGATVVLNPAPAIAALERFVGLVDIVVPNESELGVLSAEADVSIAAAKLSRTTGARCVVVTLGGRGVFAWTGDGELSIPGHRVEAIDTTGAGDAFCGALAARLAAGAAVGDAVRYANAAGALATTRAGAAPSMPSRDAVEALLAVIP